MTENKLISHFYIEGREKPAYCGNVLTEKEKNMEPLHWTAKLNYCEKCLEGERKYKQKWEKHYAKVKST